MNWKRQSIPLIFSYTFFFFWYGNYYAETSPFSKNNTDRSDTDFGSTYEPSSASSSSSGKGEVLSQSRSDTETDENIREISEAIREILANQKKQNDNLKPNVPIAAAGGNGDPNDPDPFKQNKNDNYRAKKV